MHAAAAEEALVVAGQGQLHRGHLELGGFEEGHRLPEHLMVRDGEVGVGRRWAGDLLEVLQGHDARAAVQHEAAGCHGAPLSLNGEVKDRGNGGVPLRPVELTDATATIHALAAADPEVILHAAAISAADAVRCDPARGHAVNVAATARLADWCHRHGRLPGQG